MKYIIFLVLGFTLFSCATTIKPPKYIVKDIVFEEEIITKSNIDKCLYSSFYDTYFCMNNNKVTIYSKKKMVNQIGGMGFDQSSFNELSDICLSANNKLIVLDKFSHKISKFDENGSFIQSFILNKTDEPTLIATDMQDNLFIFDAQQNEILVYDNVNNEPINNFGKFSIESPEKLVFQNNNIIVYCKNKILQFSRIGYLINEFPANIIFDDFGNKFVLKHNLIDAVDNDFQKLLTEISPNSKVNTTKENMTFWYKNRIINYEIEYKRNK